MLPKIENIFISEHNVRLIHWDNLSSQQKPQWEDLVKEAVNDPFIGGSWFTDSFLLPDKLKNKPVVFFKDKEIIGFMNPRFDQPEGEGYTEKLYWRSGVIYLMKQYRGMGIMSHILYHFFYNHYPALSWIDDNNTSSISLYLRLGFTKFKLSNLSEEEKGAWYILKGKPKKQDGIKNNFSSNW